jgi:hypothetical protein
MHHCHKLKGEIKTGLYEYQVIIALHPQVPYADAINHRGDCQAYLDYSMEDQSVVLQVDKNYKQGDQVFASYGQERPNYDLLISYGFVDESSLVDYVELEVGLVEGDRLQALKQQVLQLAGYGSPQTFPLYADRFPTQLLTYMRLVRLQDPALFSKIIFDRDVILDQANEYEVLMILMGECRSRLGNYEGGLDDELRLLKNKKLSSKERVAAQLRLSEKTILSNTMTALRNRLAPIRGIPTKGGGLKVCICGSETCIVNFTCLFSEWMFDLWLFKPFLDLFSFSLLFRIGSPLFLQLYLTWTCVVLICIFVCKRYYVFFLSFVLQFSLS